MWMDFPQLMMREEGVTDEMVVDVCGKGEGGEGVEVVEGGVVVAAVGIHVAEAALFADVDVDL
jgi:hypothetical protein